MLAIEVINIKDEIIEIKRNANNISIKDLN